MSVSLAPRARIEVKAEWPGVSRKVMTPFSGLHVVRADVLGDATRFAGGDLGAADVVEQRGLAVVDVAHDGDHRRTHVALARLDGLDLRLERLLGVVVGGLAGLVAEFLDDQHRGVVVDDFVDGDHHAHLEQRADHLAALHGELVGQLGDGDVVADVDLALDRRGRAREAVRTGGGARLLGRARLGLLARAGGSAAGALVGGQVQLAGDEQRRRAVLALVVDHRRANRAPCA
jgi:hypothetical protein